VNNVRAVQKLQKQSAFYRGGVAAEPGLDYKTMDVEGFNAPAEVTVIDYSIRKCTVSRKMKMLEDYMEFFEYDRPSWAKVRWINVDGLNWQCIKLLAAKYNLHRLAIEDLLSVQRTKIDLYQDRIALYGLPSDKLDTYVCLLLHVLIGDDDKIVIDDDDENSLESWVEDRPPDPTFWSKVKSFFQGGSKTEDMVRDAETAAGMDQPQQLHVTPIAQHVHPDRRLVHDQVKTTRESCLTVAVEQVSIFLTADGTVITFFQVRLQSF
jgi:Mg2+ and Co2+ transporter CorA